jgi:putative hemolysin
MVPRTELTAIEADAPREVVLEVLTTGGHPRVPVYRRDLDNIIGMLEVTDVLRAMVSGREELHAGSLAHETLTVPETLGADEVLAAIRRRGVREAVVIDEYGGTAGLVTFESLMERIVGDLGDALGGAGRITVHQDGSADVDGLVLVADANQRFALDIDQDIYTTVGGYVLGRLGRRARVDETIEVGGREMRVLALDGLRVAKVWLSTPRKLTTADGGGKAETRP